MRAAAPLRPTRLRPLVLTLLVLVLALVGATTTTVLAPGAAHAVELVAAPGDPIAPVDPVAPAPGVVTVDLDGTTTAPSSSIVVLLGITLLSVAPSLLLMMTSFTKIFVVLALTRNALGLQGVPPNQVLAGLSLFLSIFVMSPVLTQVNHDALQPLMKGDITQQEAWDAAVEPIREFMLSQVDSDELELFQSQTSDKKPTSEDEVSLTALVPAFVLSELKTAFIIGFIVFIPFLVIDIVVSSSLMSMGMMMLPPTLVSLPFKLLLFVMVDGWGLVVSSLLTSFHP